MERSSIRAKVQAPVRPNQWRVIRSTSRQKTNGTEVLRLVVYEYIRKHADELS
jgi:hypothetical protein